MSHPKDILDDYRDAILEEAARACEEQEKDFMSPEYAAGQPLSSLMERFACRECARAIREMMAKEEE